MVILSIFTNTEGGSVELVSVGGGTLVSGDDFATVVGGGDAVITGDVGMMKADGGVVLLVGGGGAALTGDGGVMMAVVTLFVVDALPWPVDGGSSKSERSPKSSSKKVCVWLEMVRGRSFVPVCVQVGVAAAAAVAVA